MRIVWLDPVPGETDRAFCNWLRAAAQPDARIEVWHLDRGPRHLEYAYYGALVLPDIIHAVKRAERAGFDGAVIGCFYDPGLVEAREITDDIVVTAPMESSLLLAAALGYKFSVLVGRRRWIPLMKETVARYGLSSRLASFREVGLGVLEFHQDPLRTANLLREAGRRAVEEDGAEVVILGCTATYGFYNELQDYLQVPVIDPVLASMQHVQLLVNVRRSFGWSHSKRGLYESPPVQEIIDWQLDRAYGLNQLWEQTRWGF